MFTRRVFSDSTIFTPMKRKDDDPEERDEGVAGAQIPNEIYADRLSELN